MLSRSSFRAFAALAAVVALSTGTSSCSDVTGPPADMAALAGNYWARSQSATLPAAGSFTVTENGVTTDMLAAGSFIGVIMGADGVTDGRLVIPGEIDERLPGTWRLEGGIVRFSHSADTFLRDMDFQVRNGRLEAERDFDGVTVRIVLQRVP